MLFRYDHFCFVGMGDHYLQFDYTPDQVFLLDHIILVCNVHAFKHYNPAPSPQFLLKDKKFFYRLATPCSPSRSSTTRASSLVSSGRWQPPVLSLCCPAYRLFMLYMSLTASPKMDNSVKICFAAHCHPARRQVGASWCHGRLCHHWQVGLHSHQWWLTTVTKEGETSPTFQAPNLHNWPPGVPWPEHNASLLLQLSLAHRLPF